MGTTVVMACEPAALTSTHYRLHCRLLFDVREDDSPLLMRTDVTTDDAYQREHSMGFERHLYDECLLSSKACAITEPAAARMASCSVPTEPTAGPDRTRDVEAARARELELRVVERRSPEVFLRPIRDQRHRRIVDLPGALRAVDRAGRGRWLRPHDLDLVVGVVGRLEIAGAYVDRGDCRGIDRLDRERRGRGFRRDRD